MALAPWRVRISATVPCPLWTRPVLRHLPTLRLSVACQGQPASSGSRAERAHRGEESGLGHAAGAAPAVRGSLASPAVPGRGPGCARRGGRGRGRRGRPPSQPGKGGPARPGGDWPSGTEEASPCAPDCPNHFYFRTSVYSIDQRETSILTRTHPGRLSPQARPGPAGAETCRRGAEGSPGRGLAATDTTGRAERGRAGGGRRGSPRGPAGDAPTQTRPRARAARRGHRAPRTHSLYLAGLDRLKPRSVLTS